MIDTHTHIYEPEFDEDRDAVVSRALHNGVNRLLLPNINEESIGRMMSLVEKYPDICYPMMGLHPEDVKEDYQQVLDRMHSLIHHPSSLNHQPFIAIGEVGLDFYWDTTYRTQQIDAFEQQICWARDLKLPVVIHARKSEPELIEAMDRHCQDGLKGIFHCFSGSVESARRLMKYEGFAFGIGGVITFKKSHLPETLKTIPVERIVLETDAPYLAPTPYRGTRNEPSYIPLVAEVVAQVYGMTKEELNDVTNATVERIFGIR